jgi:hypothetical protein
MRSITEFNDFPQKDSHALFSAVYVSELYSIAELKVNRNPLICIKLCEEQFFQPTREENYRHLFISVRFQLLGDAKA